MKAKYILILYAVISVIALMLLLSRENVYVMAALALGILLLAHREVWSLTRYRRLPVIDERVRENLTGAMRLTGVFFFIASIVLLIVLRFDVLEDTSLGLVISGQLVIVGLVYLISYQYYDRVRPNLGTRSMRWLKACLVTAGLALSTIALAIVLHNFVSIWLDAEEGFFFILGILVAPAVLALSLLGSLGIYLKGLLTSFNSGEPA